MVKGFEHITDDLTAEELKLLPAMIRGFYVHRGVSNAISSRKIIEKLFVKYSVKVSDVQVRKFASLIRIKRLLPDGFVLIANSSGYYVTKDPGEIKRQIDSLAGRENAIKEARLALTEDLKSLTHGRPVSFQFPEAYR